MVIVGQTQTMTEKKLPYTSQNGTEHYEADGFTWGRLIGPRQVHLTGSGSHGLAVVTAKWGVVPNSTAIPPGTVRVTRTRSESDNHRGVTTSVLRDAERVLTRMTAAMPAQVSELSLPDPMDEVRELVRRMPPGPRVSDRYYSALLKVYRLIEETGVHNPVIVLAEVTGKPEGTVKLHLRKARAELDQ
jgi:hypothetical protein